MSTRPGKKPPALGGESTWDYRVHPIHGGSSPAGGLASTEGTGAVTGSTFGRDADGVEKKTWFDPVDALSSEELFPDCPGGVCPVPWATDKTVCEEQPPELQPDEVNHPVHYTDGGIECIEAIEAALTAEEFRGYCKGNILKYIWRERLKGGSTSLKKASWYLDRITNL